MPLLPADDRALMEEPGIAGPDQAWLGPYATARPT
jgi:hypothetical protein